MVSGHELVRVISSNTESGIIVFILDKLSDRLPLVFVALGIIAQCETALNGFTVVLPLAVYKYLGVVTEAPVDPAHHIADLKPRQPDAHNDPVIGPRSGEGEQVTARFEHAQALGPHGRTRHERIPCPPHESRPARFVFFAVQPSAEHFAGIGLFAETIGRIGDHGIDRVVRE